MLSGVGHATIEVGWNEKVDADLFCIDGVTYAAYEDPDDGYRSYSGFKAVTDVKCQYAFPPQPVIAKNKAIKMTGQDKEFLTLLDAVNKKEVLVIGTDFSDCYYPYAIFHYTPENLQINQGR